MKYSIKLTATDAEFSGFDFLKGLCREMNIF
jgi:hypothetical protein